MARNGFSPATRVFEAAGAAACIVTDAWVGLEQFLEPGAEVLPAESGAEVAEILGDLAGRTFGVWGLAFKPRTDDIREAPSIEVIEGLLGKGARVQAYDPVATARARRHFGDRVALAPGPYEALEGADGLFVVTEWSEFRNPDFDRMKPLMREPVVFDGRNVFAPEEMTELGFRWYGIGRAGAAPASRDRR